MWEEYKASDDEYELYQPLIMKWLDSNHSIHVGIYEDSFALIYHDKDESEGSNDYWGVYYSDGDEASFGNLDEAKEVSLRILKLMES